MPRQKDLKRLVRARMTRTGEAYTAARAQVVRKPRAGKASPDDDATVARPTRTAAPKPEDYATLAGTSDATLKEKTGCTWERWVTALDGQGAEKMSHRDIAALVHSKYKIGGWWSQAVTVGYERIKGLRARGQRLDGSYEASKSRTFDVPIAILFEAWADSKLRRRWLSGEGVKVRTATAPKSMRLGWTDGSIVAVWFTAKGAARSSVALAHTKLPDRETAERLKQYWSERLDALGELLARQRTPSG